VHIAMWSGPRNLSTALMYAFDARAEFSVLDEPFYGSYLQASGADHPMREEILANMETDPKAVAKQLIRPRDGYLYSKQMTHHILASFNRDWFSSATHAFLIRHPARVVASYARKREKVSLDMIGYVEQWRISEEVAGAGQKPIIIDSNDIRNNPEEALRKLCNALGLSWDPAMLRWDAGGNPADGVWATHWYGAVHQSRGFAGPEGPLPELSEGHCEVVKEAMPYYLALAAHKL